MRIEKTQMFYLCFTQIKKPKYKTSAFPLCTRGGNRTHTPERTGF